MGEEGEAKKQTVEPIKIPEEGEGACHQGSQLSPVAPPSPQRAKENSATSKQRGRAGSGAPPRAGCLLTIHSANTFKIMAGLDKHLSTGQRSARRGAWGVGQGAGPSL